MNQGRALDGVRVVELATFIAAPACARFLADQGADVIKVESLGGDGTRHAPLAEGRPELGMAENVTFELENGNKRAVAMDLKHPKCFEAFMKLVSQADVFITNWRPKALEKMGLDYESLKKKYPKLIYASVTGYGDKGPDKDLPGYDYTAFWARSGMLGSLYEKGTEPMNLIPSVGDHQVGMCLAAGICAALYRAQKTGKGEKVSVSLLGTAIFMQGTMIQTAQYNMLTYPISKRESPNPLNCSYKTKDGRYIQMCVPVYDLQFPAFAKALDMECWLSDPRFDTMEHLLQGNRPLLYDAICERFKELDSKEICERLKKADIPHAIAQVWKEVLEDEQAWADDCFAEDEFITGKRILVRNPVHFEEAGLPELKKAPYLGENTDDVLLELGYTRSEVDELLQSGKIVINKKP